MPGTIYLPGDTRWSDIGQGLGKLLGNVVANQYQNQVQAGVAQIRADPQFKDNAQAQLAEVTKRFGADGVKNLTQQLDSEAKIGQLGLIGAQTRHEDQTTAQSAATTKQIGQTTDIQAAQEGPDLAAKIAEARIKGQQADANLPAITAAEGQANIAATQQRTAAGLPAVTAQQGLSTAAEADARTRQIDAETSLTNNAIKQSQYLLGTTGSTKDPNAKTGLDTMLDNAGITDAQQRARVQNAVLLGGKNPLGAAKAEIDKIAEFNARQNAQEVAPTDVRKHVDTAATQYNNLLPFLNASQDALGVVGGIKGWLTKKGFISDPDIVSQLTAGEQSVSTSVRSGGSFVGKSQIMLAGDTNPSINHNAMYNVKVTGQVAEQRIAELQADYDALKGVPKYASYLPTLQKQIDQFKGMEQTANTLWWGYDNNSKDGSKPQGTLHMFYRGQEVNDKTLQPLPEAQQKVLPSTKVFKSPDGSTATGDSITQMARTVGLTPQRAAQMFESGEKLQ